MRSRRRKPLRLPHQPTRKMCASHREQGRCSLDYIIYFRPKKNRYSLTWRRNYHWLHRSRVNRTRQSRWQEPFQLTRRMRFRDRQTRCWQIYRPSALNRSPKSPHLDGQPGKGKPDVSVVAIAPPANTASAWPLQETSLPSEISSPISTNTETSSPTFERKSSTPTVAGRLGNVDPDVKAVAVAAPAEAEDARPQQARSLLVEPVSPSLNIIEPPPPILGKGYSGLILPGRLDLENVEPAKKPDVEWAQPPLTELPPLISPSTTPPLVLKTEPSQPVLSGQPDISGAGRRIRSSCRSSRHRECAVATGKVVTRRTTSPDFDRYRISSS